MASYVEARIMPPFPAEETEECPNPWGFQSDRRLTDEQIALFVAWAEAGAPEGDPASAAELEPPVQMQLPRVDQELSSAVPFPVPPLDQDSDTMVCLVLDPQLQQDGWLEGVGLAPDDTEVVHHALVYVDETGASEALAGPEGWYDCFGGPGVEATMVAGFAAGSPPMVVPSGSGIPVRAGSRLVVQMHYHGMPEAREDQSRIQLAWTDGPPERVAYVSLFGNASSASQGLQPGPGDAGEPEFLVPAGVSGHTERMRLPVEAVPGVEYGVFLVGNHMHLVGQRMRAWIEPADGGAPLCLLDTPRWDYDWQLTYAYDVSRSAPTLRHGDTLVLECTYDNTLENPGVQRALGEVGLTEPVDVRLGEETLDEMCIFLGGVVPLGG
jgi:hypothetical protein